MILGSADLCSFPVIVKLIPLGFACHHYRSPVHPRPRHDILATVPSQPVKSLHPFLNLENRHTINDSRIVDQSLISKQELFVILALKSRRHYRW